jgi:RNA polymerase sigma-70 factor, ECF subfamily
MDGFEDWYREVYPRVVTTLTVALASPDDAAEATAEAFLKAFQRWERVRAMDRPDGWVYRVALNAGRRHGRRRTSEAVAAAGEASPPPSRSAAATEALVEFHELLAGLPERMRQIVALRHVADLTEPMIAEVLGISRSTVSSTLRDAYRRMEPAVQEERR